MKKSLARRICLAIHRCCQGIQQQGMVPLRHRFFGNWVLRRTHVDLCWSFCIRFSLRESWFAIAIPKCHIESCCPLTDQHQGCLRQNRRIPAQQWQMRACKTQNHYPGLWFKPTTSILGLPQVADPGLQNQLWVDFSRLWAHGFAAWPFQPLAPFILVGLDELGAIFIADSSPGSFFLQRLFGRSSNIISFFIFITGLRACDGLVLGKVHAEGVGLLSFLPWGLFPGGSASLDELLHILDHLGIHRSGLLVRKVCDEAVVDLGKVLILEKRLSSGGDPSQPVVITLCRPWRRSQCRSFLGILTFTKKTFRRSGRRLFLWCLMKRALHRSSGIDRMVSSKVSEATLMFWKISCHCHSAFSFWMATLRPHHLLHPQAGVGSTAQCPAEKLRSHRPHPWHQGQEEELLVDQLEED